MTKRASLPSPLDEALTIGTSELRKNLYANLGDALKLFYPNNFVQISDTLKKEEALWCGIGVVGILRGAKNEKDFQNEGILLLPSLPLNLSPRPYNSEVAITRTFVSTIARARHPDRVVCPKSLV